MELMMSSVGWESASGQLFLFQYVLEVYSVLEVRYSYKLKLGRDVVMFLKISRERMHDNILYKLKRLSTGTTVGNERENMFMLRISDRKVEVGKNGPGKSVAKPALNRTIFYFCSECTLKSNIINNISIP